MSIENYSEIETIDNYCYIDLNVQYSELMDAMSILINLHTKINITSTKRINDLTMKLKPYVNLTDEDCELLRLRLVEGMKMKKIAQQLNISENPHKRYYKILNSLYKACQQVELVDIIWK